MKKFLFPCLVSLLAVSACKKTDNTPAPPPVVASFVVKTVSLNGVPAGANKTYNVPANPAIRYTFSAPVNRATVANAVALNKMSGGGSVSYTASYANNDSVLIIQPTTALDHITLYNAVATTGLQSAAGRALSVSNTVPFVTKIDSTAKFPALSDNALMDKIQQQTFKYFWDYAHPVSGMARERSNGDDNVVTTGGTGFGIMAIPVAINRNFITRAEGLARMQTIVGFLRVTAQSFHGAFPHWLHGATGVVQPFSTKDNGADLVETSYLMAGLLAARQYFDGANAAETTLRSDINILWSNVEWDWFRNNNSNVLYWHWSPNFNWELNLPIRGWNECLITYILATASTTHPVPTSLYQTGWASGTNFLNGASCFGYTLPLGPDKGGPLFFSHYSFLGIGTNGLQDTYASYSVQTKNHSLINYSHCVANPNNHYGYSADCWGLTASDIPNGYTASSPTNDIGVIAPTAAISSMPYTPAESMRALKFFYYTLGDKLFKEYGFVDAFSLKDPWFASSFLAIDQGPIIVMLENYRSGLIWNLLTSCPEIKTSMRALGFTAPYL